MDLKLQNEIKSYFPFLNSLKLEDFNNLIEQGIVAEYDAGKVIVSEGCACNNIVFVLEGLIRVYKLSGEGKEITLYRIKSGETCILTITCLLGNVSYETVAQVEKKAKIFSVPSRIFVEIFEKSREMREFIFGSLSLRLMDVMTIVGEVTFKSIDKRLASYLYSKSQLNNSNLLKITHEAIALDLGTAREVVSRGLKDLEKRDVLKLSRGSIRIKNEAEIKKIGSM